MRKFEGNRKESKSLSFLYHTIIGRFCLKIITMPWISKLVGLYMKSRLSKGYITRFLKSNPIDMDRFEYPVEHYKTFNDFFLRELKEKPEKQDTKDLLAPCDGKLLVYSLQERNSFEIKYADYSIADMIGEKYLKDDALIMIFRLTPDDYHHYYYLDDGRIKKHKVIPGKLHTVQPIALQEMDVFVRNAREVTHLLTENFGEVIQVEVGALCVGKIVNPQVSGKFEKMSEKGYFEFGGSTIVYVFDKDAIDVDETIIENSKQGIETIVQLGEKIGEKR